MLIFHGCGPLALLRRGRRRGLRRWLLLLRRLLLLLRRLLRLRGALLGRLAWLDERS